MLLIGNPKKTVANFLTAAADTVEHIYDFDLMLVSGHIKGYQFDEKAN